MFKGAPRGEPSSFFGAAIGEQWRIGRGGNRRLVKGDIDKESPQ